MNKNIWRKADEKIMPHRKIFDITPEINKLGEIVRSKSIIDNELFLKHEVNRGLRDVKGNGVITGLTEVSDVYAFDMIDGVKTPKHGELFYRGINVEDLTAGFMEDDRFGFEETIYLLLFGQLPTKKELHNFKKLLATYRTMPKDFVKDVILEAPNSDIMNSLARSVLTMYSYDHHANDNEIANVLRQCLQLIALFPSFAIYAYHAFNHYKLNKSLIIHNPDPKLSTAENILHMLRLDGQYTKAEAKILDLALVLHAEHGGGNNSTFTTRVVTSSGTDTYSAIAAALCSLKGPRHGGANIKVVEMINDLKENVKDWTNEKEVGEYLRKLLHKEAFDKAGLIYGMGHAVYSLSDPRANMFKKFVSILSNEKDRTEEYELYKMVERLAPQIIAEERHIYKGVSANIDFYSGFVYDMLDLPKELYTPIFAISRIAGWSAHRMEEIINNGKIIRPAYINVHDALPYVKMEDRK